MTRAEAAEFLTLNVRSLDRLNLPRYKVSKGRTVYRMTDLLGHLDATKVIPTLNSNFYTGKQKIVVPKLRKRSVSNDNGDRRAEMRALVA
jgi:hypothetical protein